MLFVKFVVLLLAVLTAAGATVFVGSEFAPWLLDSSPALIGLGVLVATAAAFLFTRRRG